MNVSILREHPSSLYDVSASYITSELMKENEHFPNQLRLMWRLYCVRWWLVWPMWNSMDHIRLSLLSISKEKD